MPPPIFKDDQIFTTKIVVPARAYDAKYEEHSPFADFNITESYREVTLPIGEYQLEGWDRKYSI